MVRSGGGAKSPASAPEQEQALRDAFQRFDVNKDGHIQEAEFRRLMEGLGGFSDKEIKRLFGEADKDKSGSVDWREFVTWICKGSGAQSLGTAGAASFSRLLKLESADEAQFVEQAALGRQVEQFIKEANPMRTENEDQNSAKRRQNSTKKAHNNGSNRQSVEPSVDAAYEGFRLPVPYTFDGAVSLMQYYLVNGEEKPLHAKYVSALTTDFTQAYKRQHPKPVVEVDVPNPGRLVIVGDTHGQLADLLHIMHQLGPPTATNRYLFNGDIADRGHQAVEICMILFAFFMADPECLMINRGNHENEDMNALDADSGGGFQDEVVTKYGLPQYRRFLSAFRSFSLAAVVQKEIFVVHGGLARVKSLTIDYINSIDHQACTAPHPMASTVKDQIFTDLLWSDPTETPGKYKSDRGIGIKFGPDITARFCIQNKLRFVVRSHQVPDDQRGFMKMHEGRCVTIFSASNYCGSGGNYGSVMVLASEHFPKYEIYEHYAAPLDQLPKLMGVGDWQEIGKKQEEQDRDVINTVRFDKEVEKMIIGVIERKPDLWTHFCDQSQGNNFATVEFWEEMCSEIVDAEMPWREAAYKWEIINKQGKIDVPAFLERFVVNLCSERYSAFRYKAVKFIYKAIVALDMDLEETLLLFDVDGDGTVDISELRQVLGMFDLGLTSAQITRLAGHLFTRGSQNDEEAGGNAKRIKVIDFLSHFTVVYKNAAACSGADQGFQKWMGQALQKIGTLIIRTPEAKLMSEFEQAALKIQKVARGKKARAEVADKEKGGKADAARRQSAAPTGKASPTLGATGSIDVSSQVPGGASLSKGDEITDKMVKLFKAIDSSGDGILQLDEFVSGLMKIPGISDITIDEQKLNEGKVREVAQAIDISGNGSINYLEFLQAFSIEEQGDSSVMDTLGEDITTVLFRHRHAIKMGCHYLDTDGTGKISSPDCATVLQGVNSALSRPERTLTSTQIALLVECLTDPPPEGSLAEEVEESVVNYEDFLKSFQIVDTQKEGMVIKKF